MRTPRLPIKLAFLALPLACSNSGKSTDGGAGDFPGSDSPADVAGRTDVPASGGAGGVSSATNTGGATAITTAATGGSGGSGGNPVTVGTGGAVSTDGPVKLDAGVDSGAGGGLGGLDASSDVVVRDSTNGAVPEVSAGDIGRSDLALDSSADAPAEEAGQVAEVGSSETGGPVDTGLPSPAVVTFVNGRAQGGMTGYGWAAMGPMDSVTSPTCGGVAITNGSPCPGASTAWATPDVLCASGTIPVLPTVPSSNRYDQDWGIAICVDVTNPAGGTLGEPYRTIIVSYTGQPSDSEMHVLVHRSGDDPTLPWTQNYCHYLTTPTQTMSLSSFNTGCWDNSGTMLTLADVPIIDRVCIHLYPSPASLIAVENLCLTGITFGY